MEFIKKMFHLFCLKETVYYITFVNIKPKRESKLCKQITFYYFFVLSYFLNWLIIIIIFPFLLTVTAKYSKYDYKSIAI